MRQRQRDERREGERERVRKRESGQIILVRYRGQP